MMVGASLMVVTIPSFAVQRSAKNMQIAPAECGDSISEKLLDQADSIVIKLNSRGEITFVNEYTQKFFGFPEKDLIGKPLIGTIAPKTESSGRDLQLLLEDVVTHPERHVTNINENIRRSGKRVLVS
jgi:two-component system cell cycle sensor histidine kinase/response regulator CckA